MAWDLIANVVISGVLTGLVYGLMALGLSVIFGVVRVVNFAHGEMMTIAMYAAVVLFASLKLDPFLAIVPVAAAFFAFGYAMQTALINPFITRPEHSQFMLLVAVATHHGERPAAGLRSGREERADRVPARILRAGAAPVRQGARVRRRRGAGGDRGPVRVLPLHPHRQGDPRLRRQLPRRQGGRPEREAPVRPHLRPGRGLRGGRRLRHERAAGSDAAARARLHAARLRHRHRRRPGLDGRRAARRRADRRVRSDGGIVHHALRRRACSASAC